MVIFHSLQVTIKTNLLVELKHQAVSYRPQPEKHDLYLADRVIYARKLSTPTDVNHAVGIWSVRYVSDMYPVCVRYVHASLPNSRPCVAFLKTSIAPCFIGFSVFLPPMT